MSCSQLTVLLIQKADCINHIIILLQFLTGSANIITSTVAFPGVSKLTNGVNIVLLVFFIVSSISFNCNVQNKPFTSHNTIYTN